MRQSWIQSETVDFDGWIQVYVTEVDVVQCRMDVERMFPVVGKSRIKDYLKKNKRKTMIFRSRQTLRQTIIFSLSLSLGGS